MIVAVVLAAGLSRRMGAFKLLLPWGESTVLEQVLATLGAAGVSEIVVVTGHRADEVTRALVDTSQERPLSPWARSPLSPWARRRQDFGVRIVRNPSYLEGGMLGSIQAGLLALGEEAEAVLLCLGDQPQMQVDTVQAVVEAMREGLRVPGGSWQIVIPSYGLRGGHPVGLARAVWPAVLAATGTLRDVLNAHRERIRYIAVDTPTVLADLDTPEDYEGSKPTGKSSSPGPCARPGCQSGEGSTRGSRTESREQVALPDEGTTRGEHLR